MFESLKYSKYQKQQSPVEIILIIVPSIYETFASVLLTSFFMNGRKERLQREMSLYIKFFLDMFLIVLPLLLDLTVFANDEKHVQHVFFILIGYLVYLAARSKTLKTSQEANVPKPLYFVANMRATINLITVAAILAVDFESAFPRRFTKTTTYGFSLMDVGVGLYVFSNGIVAPELNGQPNPLQRSVVNSIPLLILGISRAFLVKLTNYHVNPTEYGLHWNFFITLALTKIFSSGILRNMSLDYTIPLAAGILFFYESFLQMGVADWILKDHPRTTFFLANREGIISTIGYLGLYFLSVSLGKLINKKYNQQTDYYKLSIHLGLCSFLFFYLTFVCDRYLGVSRRLASAGYCFWIIFIGTFMALLFLLVEIVLVKLYKLFSVKHCSFVPLIYQAINYNGLLFFLLANVLTGFLNMAVINHSENPKEALYILLIYMIINCGFATILLLCNINITAVMNYVINTISS